MVTDVDYDEVKELFRVYCRGEAVTIGEYADPTEADQIADAHEVECEAPDAADAAGWRQAEGDPE